PGEDGSEGSVDASPLDSPASAVIPRRAAPAGRRGRDSHASTVITHRNRRRTPRGQRLSIRTRRQRRLISRLLVRRLVVRRLVVRRLIRRLVWWLIRRLLVPRGLLLIPGGLLL